MRNLLLFLCVCFLFSCKKYDNTIQSRDIDPQSLKWIPVTDSSGVHNVKQYDSVYTVSPTWHQAWIQGGKDGARTIFWIGVVIFIIGIPILLYFENNQRTAQDKSYFIGIIIMFIGFGIAAMSFGWDKWNSDKTITKTQYDQLIQKDGDLHEFWDTVKW